MSVDLADVSTNYKYRLETSVVYQKPDQKFRSRLSSDEVKRGGYSESHMFDYLGKTYVIRLTALSNGNKYFTFWYGKLLLGGRHYNDEYGFHDSMIQLSPWENQMELLQHEDFVNIIENQIMSVPFK